MCPRGPHRWLRGYLVIWGIKDPKTPSSREKWRRTEDLAELPGADPTSDSERSDVGPLPGSPDRKSDPTSDFEKSDVGPFCRDPDRVWSPRSDSTESDVGPHCSRNSLGLLNENLRGS